jgi:hypothetical protein
MTLSKDILTNQLKVSDAWAARAIYRLGKEFDQMAAIFPGAAAQRAQDDKLFFESLIQFFADNGFFTDRHIAVARVKFRQPYIDYLFMVATS